MANSEIAKEILLQLGGTGRVQAMVGGRDFVYSDNSLSFKFSGCPEANSVKIFLSPKDLYEVTFYNIGRDSAEEIKKIAGIYCEELIRTFENFTGLYLSL